MVEIKKCVAVSAILAFLTCYLLGGGVFGAEPVLAEASSVFLLPLLFGVGLLYGAAFFPLEKRRFVISLFFGALFGLMIVLGEIYAKEQTGLRRAVPFLCVFAAASLLSAALISLFLAFLTRQEKADAKWAWLFAPFAEKGAADGRKKAGGPGWGGLFLIFLVFFVPAFLAVYPGIYSYDASVQVQQLFGGLPLTTHHPLLHTLFFGGCLQAGKLLFGSYQYGLAVHSAVQGLLMGAVFCYAIRRMAVRKRPALLLLFAVLFLLVNPYMHIFILLTTKDVLFGGVFLLLFLFSLDLLEDRESFFKSPLLVGRFFSTALLLCFLRNQGIYVFLLFSLFLCWNLFLWKHREAGRFALFTFLLTALYLAVTGPVSGALGVEKGDAREMLSVPMQQLARAYQEAPEQLTQEEKDYILRLIPEEYLSQYVSINADLVKNGFQTEVVRESPALFFSTWLSIGRKTPLVYLDSFFLGSWGNWYPGAEQYWINYILFDGAFMEAPYNVLHIQRESRLPGYESFLRKISLTPEYEKIPLLALILNQSFPLWLALAAAAALIWRRKYAFLIPLTLIFGYWGTLLLGPVTSVRYAIPLLICVPSLAGEVLFKDI